MTIDPHFYRRCPQRRREVSSSGVQPRRLRDVFLNYCCHSMLPSLLVCQP